MCFIAAGVGGGAGGVVVAGGGGGGTVHVVRRLDCGLSEGSKE